MNKWVKRCVYFIIGILGLLIITFLLLQTSWAKNIIRQKLQIYISKKTNTEFRISKIDYSFPTWVEIDGIFMRDLNKDTLLYGKTIKAELAMLKLISGKYQVDRILLDDIYINLHKKVNDSVFNYQFVMNAFKSKSEKATHADTSAIDLSLNEIILKKIRFNMLDEGSGNFTKMSVTDFNLKLKNIDISKMNFDINKLYANELKFQLLIKKAVADTTTVQTTSTLPILKVDSFIVKNSFIEYEDDVNKIKSNNTIGLMQVTRLTNKDNATTFKGKLIQLSDADIAFDHSLIAAKNAHHKKDPITVTNNYAFVIDEIELNNNQVTYNNIASPAKINGLDYAHLAIKGLRLKGVDNSYMNGKIQSTIKGFSFKDKSGFEIDSLSGIVKMDSSNIDIKYLFVKTATSTIRANSIVYQLSQINNGGSPGGFPQNNIEINSAIISKKDLDLLADGLTAKYKKQMNALGDLQVSANITGTSKQLLIHNLTVRSLRGQTFALQVSGTATNFTDTKNISYNLNIKKFIASKALIDPFVNEPKQIVQLPAVIAVSGLLAGNSARLQLNLQMVSAFGKANVKGSIINFKDLAKMQYDLVLNAADFETGKWIYKDSLLGKLTGTITAKGSNGFNIKTNSIKTTADIKSFRVQQNNINNIKLSLNLVKRITHFIASVNDELLRVNIEGNANVHTEYPAVSAVINLQKADLFALGFAKDSLIISTLAKIDLKNLSPKNLDGKIELDSTLVTNTSGKIFSDTTILVALVRNDSTIICLSSPFADATVESNLTYIQMPELLKEVMANYLSAQNNTPAAKAPLGIIAASLVIKPNEQYKTLVKKFSFNKVLANATVSNTNKDSMVKGTITAQEIIMGTNKVSNLTANIRGTKDSLQLKLNTDTLSAGNILLYDAVVNAGYGNNILSVDINTKDEKKIKQFALAITAMQNQTNNGYDIHLKDSLVLNHTSWQVNNSNRILTSTQGFNISNFAISNNKQKISIASTSEAFNAPVKVDIDNFKLTTITAALNKDSMLVDGLLNADFTASNFNQPIPTVDGTAQLDSILYQHMSVGNFNLKAGSDNGSVNITGTLKGNGNNVDMSGNYNASNIDVKINLNPLSLLSLQPFTQGNLTRSKGTLTGPVTITGAASDPVWNGELNFNGVQTTAAKFGTFLKIDGQKITLQYPTISFNNFTVFDSIGNPLKINGTLTQDNQKNFISDLSVTTSNFNVINNTSADNNMIYGKAIVEVDAAVKGNINAPDLTGNILVKNGTEVTYVKQSVRSTLNERNELIEFVDMDTIRNLVTKQTLEDVIRLNKNKNKAVNYLQYNINLEVEPEAKFKVIVDPATSDELDVQGKAQINMGVNPNGDVTLTGIYDLKGGSYQLNYGPVKRKFLLREGSNIKLSGYAENAEAHITAAYEISTSPLDLIGNEVAGLSSTENTQYKRKVPFEVLLKIDGTVSKPELSFDIIMKDKAEGVSYELATTIKNKLTQLRNDPSAMNKQVFALLALSRFISDQSQDYFGGNGTTNTNLLANESVSGFLNAAVNDIAADLIKGVDIDINLKTINDDPSAVRTDLNIMLGKAFLNDRLNVSFGKNFTVDGNDPSVKGRRGENSNIEFIPDVNTTYKLSADGKYLMRAYRRSQYEAIMDGYFIETGLAFSFTMDYDKFKEIVSKKKK